MKRGFVVKECQKCGGDTGFYVKERVKGYTEVRYQMDGTYDEEGNSTMYDGMEHTPATKWAYCRDCHNRIIKLENINLEGSQ